MTLPANFDGQFEDGLSISDSLGTVVPPSPSPTDIPSPIFSEGEGAAVHRLSETDNPSSNCPSKLADKVRRMVHSKLNYSILKLRRTNYLT